MTRPTHYGLGASLGLTGLALLAASACTQPSKDSKVSVASKESHLEPLQCQLRDILAGEYGLKPKIYSGFFNDSQNAAERVFLTALPEVTAAVNQKIQDNGFFFTLTQAEVAVNFIAEGAYYALEDGRTTGLNGYSSLGIDTLVSNLAALRPWLSDDVYRHASDPANQYSAFNEQHIPIKTAQNLTLEQGLSANASMFAYYMSLADRDLRARGSSMNDLPERGAFFWATLYFNSGPGRGRTLLNEHGPDWYAAQWTKPDDYKAYWGNSEFNGRWRMATLDYLVRSVFPSGHDPCFDRAKCETYYAYCQNGQGCSENLDDCIDANYYCGYGTCEKELNPDMSYCYRMMDSCSSGTGCTDDRAACLEANVTCGMVSCQEEPPPPACVGTTAGQCGWVQDTCGQWVDLGDPCSGNGQQCVDSWCQTPAQTCTAYGQCGWILDSCGQWIDFGDPCTANGQQCVDSWCQTPARTCTAYGQCGWVQDDCGQWIDFGDPCSGNGQQCVDSWCQTPPAPEPPPPPPPAPVCTPYGQCGWVPDTCGQWVDLGDPCSGSGQQCVDGWCQTAPAPDCTPYGQCGWVPDTCGQWVDLGDPCSGNGQQCVEGWCQYTCNWDMMREFAQLVCSGALQSSEQGGDLYQMFLDHLNQSGCGHQFDSPEVAFYYFMMELYASGCFSHYG